MRAAWTCRIYDGDKASYLRPQSHTAYCSALYFTLTRSLCRSNLSLSAWQTDTCTGLLRQKRCRSALGPKQIAADFFGSVRLSGVSTGISCSGECSFKTPGKAQSTGRFPAEENIT